MPLPADWICGAGPTAPTYRRDRLVENPSYSLRILWNVMRTELSAARQARADRRVLAREIADYASPRDLADLEAMLERHAEDETDSIRGLIAARAYAQPEGIPGSGSSRLVS
jgi:hypothetical protein